MRAVNRLHFIAILFAISIAWPAFRSSAQAGCVPPPPGLVSWWRAEGNALDSVGGNNGTLTNDAGYGPGMVGMGFVFGGAAAAVQVGYATNLQLQDFTIEAWVKRSDTNVVSANTSNPANGMFFAFGLTGNGYGFGIKTGGQLFLTEIGANELDSSAQISDTNFHHVALTKFQTNVVFYLDGAAYPTGPYTGTFGFGSLAAIGAIGDTLGNSFLGTIDELSVYSRPLSDAEIMGIFNAGSGGKCVAAAPPAILEQPANQSIFALQSATFNVVATGGPFVDYQWSFNGTNIVAATNSILTLSNVQPDQAGAYAVVVSNSLGRVTSSHAMLIVNTIEILAQPVSQTNVVGNDFSFTVQAIGAPPLSYQWSFDGTNIAGATNDEIPLSNLTVADAGLYYVTVSDTFTNLVSQPANLAVLTPGRTNQYIPRPDAALLASAIQAGGYVRFFFDGTIWLTNTITISNNVVLDGSGYNVTISGSNSVPLFVVPSGVNFSLTNVTLADGWTQGYGFIPPLGPTPPPAAGAAIYNSGTVQAVQCVFSNNRALPYFFSATGGAIANTGTLIASNCLFVANQASGGEGNESEGDGAGYGGAIYSDGTLNIAGCVFTNNGGSGIGDFGGAIYNDENGTLYVSNSVFANNYCVGDGIPSDYDSNGTDAQGGAIFNAGGIVDLAATSFSSNTTLSGPASNNETDSPSSSGTAAGGAIYSSSGTISANGITMTNNGAIGANGQSGGLGITFLSGGPAYGGGLYVAGGTAVVSNGLFLGNSVAGGAGFDGPSGPAQGGCVFNAGAVSFIGCSFGDNAANGASLADPMGGAIYNVGTLQVQACVLSNNMATGSPNPVLGSEGGDSFGGAIYNVGVLSIEQSAFSENGAVAGYFLYMYYTTERANGHGGAVANLGFTSVSASTFSNDFSSGATNTGEEIYNTGSLVIDSNGAVTVSVGKTPELSYQWQLNGTNIAGATTTSLNLAGAQFNDTSVYSLLTNSATSLTSNLSEVYSVPLLVPPTFAIQPSSQTLPPGTNMTISAIAVGLPLPAYQWYFNGSNALAGATNSSLILTNVQQIQSGQYSVVASNSQGTLSSASVSLTVLAPPLITVGPQSVTTVAGQSATFSATALGPALSYQWQMDGTNLINGANIYGANAATLILNTTSADNAGDYSVVVTNTYGGVTSAIAALTVLVPPLISAQEINGALALTWAATPNFAYQLQYQTNLAQTNWINSGAEMTATNEVLTTSIAISGPQRFYRVILLP